jgi:hypothetical protein
MSTFDPDKYLRDEEEKYKPTQSSSTGGSVTNFDPDKYLAAESGTTPTTQEFGVQQGVQMALPAASTALPGPTGAGQLIADVRGAGVTKPLTQSFTGRIGEYLAKPGKAIIDAGTMMATGIPGAAPAALYDTYKSVQEAVPRMRQALGSVDLDPKLFSEFANKLNPNELSQLSQSVSKMGGKQAMAAFQFPARLAQDPAAIQAFEALRGQAAAAPGMAARIGGPLMRGAAKVLGPVGLGMDIYQAQQFAQESQLGPRLAQGQGRMAQQAFRNMAANQQYGGLTQEQQQMLEQDKINQAIRRKAASKVLGPVIPQGY